jgi:hypothetical protein
MSQARKQMTARENADLIVESLGRMLFKLIAV